MHKAMLPEPLVRVVGHFLTRVCGESATDTRSKGAACQSVRMRVQLCSCASACRERTRAQVYACDAKRKRSRAQVLVTHRALGLTQKAQVVPRHALHLENKTLNALQLVACAHGNVKVDALCIDFHKLDAHAVWHQA